MRFRAPFAIMLLMVPAALACAQATSPHTPQTPLISTRSTLVLVPTLVKTKAGELVYALTANDFIITDNSIEQKVALEEDTGGQPLALVVAVETGGAGGRQLGMYRNLATMIDAVVGSVPHRVAVVAFDSEPTLFQDFTPDLNMMDDAIHNLSPGDSGAAILDGLAFSVNLLRTQPPEYRRAILLISETVDRGSHIKLDDALRAISDANTAIYSIGFSSNKAELGKEAKKFGYAGMPPLEPGPEHGCFSHDPKTDPTVRDNGTKGSAEESRSTQYYDCFAELLPPLRLAKMAEIAAHNSLRNNASETVAKLTGGEYFHFSNQRDLELGLVTISNHLPNRYVLSFHPQSPQPGLHAIEVKLKDHPDLILTARSSYWANSTATSEPHP